LSYRRDFSRTIAHRIIAITATPSLTLNGRSTSWNAAHRSNDRFGECRLAAGARLDWPQRAVLS
jgi:hypothetical protein